VDNFYIKVKKFEKDNMLSHVEVDFTITFLDYKYSKFLSREEVIALAENLEDTVHELLECIDQEDDEE